MESFWGILVDYRIVSLILAIISSFTATSSYFGLIERFMVSSYQVYYFVLALMVFLTN